jgi:oligopeptidase B
LKSSSEIALSISRGHIESNIDDQNLTLHFKVWRTNLSALPKPSLIFEETDESFYVGIGKSRSEKILFISSGSAITSEERICPAGKPEGDFQVLIPRKHDVQYDALHLGEGEVFVLNLRDKERPNGEIVILNGIGSEPSVLLPHSPEVKIEGISLSSGWLVVWQRKQGLQCATIFTRGTSWSNLVDGKDLSFDEEPAYSIWAGAQGDFDSPLLRLVYTSLTTPSSTIDVNLKTGKRAVKKVQPVPNFDKSLYVTDRIWCTSHDGVKVPISLVYRKDMFKKDGSSRLLLDGYGSYEISNDPYFSSSRLPLLDRGFVYAIAHIRGGGEMGRLWYENGKFKNKPNTFKDFIAAAEQLVADGFTSPQHLAIEGRSAGGLLIGAVVNLRPDLFKSAIAGVPFVDCLTTMLDETIPLTVTEWEEWGNPVESKEVYSTLKSYSPMDNILVSVKPNMLVTGGLHDPRVGYWEPAKYVARLRAAADPASDRVTLLKMELGAGHFSVTGRFEKLKETAEEWAFLIKFT